MSDPISKLVIHLSRLPGIGEKSATRLAFHMIQAPDSHVKGLANALLEVVDKVKLCDVCMSLTESECCHRCLDQKRDPTSICVVASPSDLAAIDRGGHYRGKYHVLHGLLSPLDGVGPEDIKIAELIRRLGPKTDGVDQEDRAAVEEVIIATNASVEGEATAMYLGRIIKPLDIKVSRIATGLPVGGELEYSDGATIARALAGRSAI